MTHDGVDDDDDESSHRCSGDPTASDPLMVSKYESRWAGPSSVQGHLSPSSVCNDGSGLNDLLLHSLVITTSTYYLCDILSVRGESAGV